MEITEDEVCGAHADQAEREDDAARRDQRMECPGRRAGVAGCERRLHELTTSEPLEALQPPTAADTAPC